MARTEILRSRLPKRLATGVLAGLLFAAILLLTFRQRRSIDRSRDAIEQLAALLSEPTLAAESPPIAQRFAGSLAAAAAAGGISVEEFRRECDHFDAGFIPGLRPTGYDAALADLAEERFATALREALECESGKGSRAGRRDGRCELLAGEILTAEGRFDEAAEHLRTAVLQLGGGRRAGLLTTARSRLADALQRKNDPNAEPFWRSVIEAGSSLPDSNLGLANGRLGQLLLGSKRPAEAEGVLARAEALASKQHGGDPLLPSRIANEHGLSLMQLGRPAEAETSFRRSLAVATRGSDRTLEAVVSGNLGFAIGRQGRISEAEPLVRKTVDYVEKSVRENPFSIPAEETLATQLRGLGEVLKAGGKYAEEEQIDRRLYEVIKSARGSANADSANVLTDLAFCLRQLGKFDEAEADYREAIGVLERACGSNHLELAHPLNDLAVMLRDEGRYTEAARLMRRAMEVTDLNLSTGDPARAVTMGNLGLLMAYNGEADQGETLIRRAISLQNKLPGPPDAALGSMFNNLAESLILQGKREEAVPYYERALAIAADGSRRAGKETPDLARARETLKACLRTLQTPETEIKRRTDAIEGPAAKAEK